jgi:hypothetical protein
VVDNITSETLLQNAKKLGGTIKIMEVKEVFGDNYEILDENIDWNYE